MPQAVFFCSTKMKKGIELSDLLAAAKKLNDEYISKQKGYVAWQQLVDGDTWADYLVFETMEDVKAFEADSGNAGELAQNFYSFLNLSTCKVNYFTVEASY